MSDEIQKFSQIDAAVECVSMLPANATTEDVYTAVENLPKLKHLLEAAGVYKAKAAKYLRLEAQTWIDITELCSTVSVIAHSADGDEYEPDDYWDKNYYLDTHGYKETLILINGEFTPQQRQIIEYLAGLSKEARENIPNDCAEQVKSILSYARKSNDERLLHDGELELVKEGEWILRQYRETGKADVTIRLNTPLKRLRPEVIDAYQDRLRDKLTGSGAVGITNNQYINPEIASKEELKTALGIKGKNIANCTHQYNVLAHKLGLPNHIDNAFTRDGELIAKVKDAYVSSRKASSFFTNELTRMANCEGGYAEDCPADYRRVYEVMTDVIDEHIHELARLYGKHIRNVGGALYGYSNVKKEIAKALIPREVD